MLLKRSKREQQIMDILYKNGPLPAKHVHDAINDAAGLSSTRKCLFLMEQKGWLQSEKHGKENVYSPATPRQEASKNALEHLVETFFGGSKSKVLTALFDSSDSLTAEDISSIEKLILESKREE